MSSSSPIVPLDGDWDPGFGWGGKGLGGDLGVVPGVEGLLGVS